MRQIRRFLAVALVAASTAAPGADPAPAAPAAPAAVVAEARVATAADDVEEHPNGYPMLTSSDLELVDADEGADQVVGLRFTGLAIPQGASVTEAWVQFSVDEAQSTPASLTVAGLAGDDTPAFTTAFHSLSTRPRTGSSVAWAPDPWAGVGSAPEAARTPDLATVVQELVDRPGWTTASALGLVVTGTGHRTAIAHDLDPARAPLLHVTYTPPPPPDPTLVTVDVRVGSPADDAEESSAGVTRSSADLELVDADLPQTVAVRFTGLGLPPGARIVRSWIQFTADEADTATTDLVVAGQDLDNAALLGPDNANLSSRPRTSATVAWSPAAWTVAGESGAAQRTPDLSAVIQEVVDRPYWWSGSALGFTLTGTGRRTAVAFDGDPNRAPALHVEYRPGVPTTSTSTVRRLAAVGDFGNGGETAGRVANLIHGLDVDEVITTGDNSYTAQPIDDNIGRFYQSYLADYPGAYGTGSPHNRFFPALGNHDYSDGGGIDAQLAYFTLPGRGATSAHPSGNERYYDVVLGPVHLFVVNTNEEEPDGTTADSTQARWLREGLGASTSPWQVIALHHSPYSSGAEHGSDPRVQWPFAAWGADAVLSGHDHDYERLEVDGIPYFVTGLGGVSRFAAGTMDPNSARFWNADDGALLIEACAGRLDFSFHTLTSGVVDTRHVGGATCTPTPTTVTTTVTDAVATEAGADPGSVTLTRTGPTDRPLVVRYTVGGTATPGADHQALPGTAVIPAGATSTTVTIAPIDDRVVEAPETVLLTLLDGNDHDPGDPGSATVSIVSDDASDVPAVSQTQWAGSVASGSILSLQVSDNRRLVLQEAVTGITYRTSALEYRWRFTVPPGQDVTVAVEAFRSASGEGDNFLFEWLDGATWRPLVTVTKAADDNRAQTAPLPPGTSGTVTVRVRDSNRITGRTVVDTVAVDRLVLRLLPR